MFDEIREEMDFLIPKLPLEDSCEVESIKFLRRALPERPIAATIDKQRKLPIS